MLFKKEYKVGDVVTFFLKDDKEKFIATFKVELESLTAKSFYYLKGFTEKYGEEYGIVIIPLGIKFFPCMKVGQYGQVREL